MSLICTAHYLNQQKHSSVMGFSDENKKRILEAKALEEDMKGENHHELQCSSILVIFSDSHISSRPDVFCKKGVLRNLANFTGKRLCQSLFFNKVPGLTVLKRDSGSGVFLWILRTPFPKNTFSYRTPPVAVSVAMEYIWIHAIGSTYKTIFKDILAQNLLFFLLKCILVHK